MIQTYLPQKIIDALTPHITKHRRARIERLVQQRLGSISVALECPTDLHNALAVVRTAEALGLHNVHMINPEGQAIRARRITQGAFRWTDIHQYTTLDDFLEVIHPPRHLVGTHMDAPLTISDLPIDQPICLLMGNEHSGLSPAAMSACNTLVKIPLYGMTESLNLSVAAGMCLHDIVTRKRITLPSLSDLTPEQALALKAKYYKRCVPERLLDSLLP